MARKHFGMVDDGLLDRVDAMARELGQTRRVFGERALEAALSEAKGARSRKQAGPVPVPSANPEKGIAVEGVRPAASPRAPAHPNVIASPALARFAAKAPKKARKR